MQWWWGPNMVGYYGLSNIKQQFLCKRSKLFLHNKLDTTYCLHSRQKNFTLCCGALHYIALHCTVAKCSSTTLHYCVASSQMGMVTTSASVMGEAQISHKETLTKENIGNITVTNIQ